MEAPPKPDPSDCCNSGCSPCILDVYEVQLKKYNDRNNKNATEVERSSNCMSQTVYTSFKLMAKQKHTEDTYFYTFKLANGDLRYKQSPKTVNEQSDNTTVQYKSGQHFLLKGFDGSKQFTRAYTPIPHKTTDRTSFTILVRLYPMGRMSQILHDLEIGDETSWRGPYGDYHIEYDYKHLLLIAQGTGIAPIYAVIDEMLQNDQCEVFVRLFFCCRTTHDVLLRDELYELKKYWNFHYELFLSDSKSDCTIKYNETVHFRRLQHNDVYDFFANKNPNECRLLICGSKSFSDDFSQLECVDRKYMHVF